MVQEICMMTKLFCIRDTFYILDGDNGVYVQFFIDAPCIQNFSVKKRLQNIHCTLPARRGEESL